jgi:hypothetical protein
MRKLENRSNEKTSVGRLYTGGQGQILFCCAIQEEQQEEQEQERKKEKCDNGDASLA